MYVGCVAVNGKADRNAVERSLTDTFKISKEFMKPIVALLCKFELAIPLDRETFLIPSLLVEMKEQFSRVQYNFPRKRIMSTKKGRPYSVTSAQCSDIAKFPTNTLNTEYLSAVEQQRIKKGIELSSTGMCFRRIFITNHIPANFWPRVIARFLASAESFYRIISSNWYPEIQPTYKDGLGDALMCMWSYGKNYIELKMGNNVILCVNALFGIKSVYDSKHDKRKVPVSHSVEKLRKMQIYFDMDTVIQATVSDGFEVNVPDYVVISYSKSGGEVHQSVLMSMQILSHVLETIDEIFKDWFEGLLELGIYSEKNLCHFIPCPYCYGDNKALSSTDDDYICLRKNGSQKFNLLTDGDPVGFSVQHCLFRGRRSNIIKCPHHGKLALKCLTPDLVSK